MDKGLSVLALKQYKQTFLFKSLNFNVIRHKDLDQVKHDFMDTITPVISTGLTAVTVTLTIRDLTNLRALADASAQQSSNRGEIADPLAYTVRGLVDLLLDAVPADNGIVDAISRTIPTV